MFCRRPFRGFMGAQSHWQGDDDHTPASPEGERSCTEQSEGSELGLTASGQWNTAPKKKTRI